MKKLNKNGDKKGMKLVSTQFKKGQKPWNTGIKGEEYNSHQKKGSVWNKGLSGYKIHTKEHKEELKKSFTGNKLREGKEPWNKGKKGYKLKPKTEEVKKRISESLKGHPCYKSKERNKNISLGVNKRLKEGGTPSNFKHGNSRKHKDGKPYSHFVWCSQNISHVPKGFIIHHRDLNPKNDKINNLTIVSRSDHIKMHHQLNRIIKGIKK